MTALYEATKQALAFTMRDFSTVRDFEAAKAVLQDTIRSALVEEEKAVAWLAERKEHWRKEKEKIQATDPELSAALGWPGGISDPVLDRKTLLQMVAALRLTSKQALEAWDGDEIEWFKRGFAVMENLRAALAQQDEPVEVAERERVASQRDGCVTHQLDTFGPVDIGASIRAGELVEAQQAEPAHDRHGACPTHCCPVHGCKYMHDDCPVAAGAVQPVYPRNNGCESCADDALAQQDEPARGWVSMDEYKRLQGLVTSQGIRLMEYESKQPQQAEPVEPVEPVAWMVYIEGGASAYVTDNPRDLIGAYRALPLYTAPPQRTMVPLTEEEILAAVGWERAAMYMKLTPNFPVDEAKKETLTNARAVEKASWEKNHGKA